MNSIKKYLYRASMITFIIVSVLNFSLVHADDTTGNTDYEAGDETAGSKDSNEWALSALNGENYSGTKYTIVDSSGAKHELTLPAGTTIAGSDSIKGYQSSGFPNLDYNGAEFNLPADGILELQREDWAAVARKQGNEELAKSIESGTSFTGYAEQYLYVYDPTMKTNRQMTASEAKALLDAGILDMGTIAKGIEASYNSFTEKDREYLEKQLIMQALGLTDDMKGWAGYEYEEEDIAPKEDNKEPTPIKPEDPKPEPKPDPELPPPSNRYTITEGLAGDSGYSATVTIDNSKFGVAAGKPIPTDEPLTLTGCTTLVGAVENLGLNTVTFTPWVYTVYASWSREVERTGTRQKVVNGVPQEDSNGNPVMESYTYMDTIGGTESASTPLISGSTQYYKIRSYTNWGTAESLTVTNESFGSYTFSAPKGISYSPTIIPDSSRITEKTLSIGGFEYPEDAKAAAEARAASASWSDFWTVKTDILNSSQGIITSNGPVSDGACNLLSPGNVTTLQVKNKSVDGAYPSSGTHTVRWLRLGGSKTGWGFTPNSVKIHTPIHNELIITSPSTNELVDVNLAGGNKIVTLDEEFTVKVELNGNSHYYTPITTALAKYVKEVYIDCGVCGKRIPAAMHTCKVPVTLEDNKTYPIKTTVIAKNVWSGGGTDNNTINIPDDIYTLTQDGEVYIVGKIYDLEVRTTDDPGWKLREAEKLSKLPLGEVKDNGVISYKYGIKLGYRAYFDLKTLGTATQSVNIKPKIYYITKDGKVKEDITLYYKTSKTEYKKLEKNDITINMQLTTTKGEINNSAFKRELLLTKVSPKYEDVNYKDIINIGGLNRILLDRANSVITKYKGKEYTGELGDVSRRWLGEIYLPSSTIISDNKINKDTMKQSDIVTNISRGKGVLEEGYLMITFENIDTTAENIESYLNYALLRDSDGVQISPETPSVLVQEKLGKDEITLPNGIEIKNLSENFINTDAPIIIYDVSLRANDDYESSGTH